MRRCRILVSCLASLVLTLAATASPVSSNEASRAARAWAARGKTLGAKLGKSVARVHRHATSDGTPFYAVKMQGGGTVFLSSDTEITPVIAFTADDRDFSTLDPNEPLWALLNGDLSQRGGGARNVASKVLSSSSSGTSATQTKSEQLWSELLAEDNPTDVTRAYATGQPRRADLDDVRVAPLVKSKWSQSTTSSGKACWNYYTPNGKDKSKFVAGAAGNEVCGCVATAMSQVMRYHEYPKASVTPVTRTCGWGTAYNQEAALSLTMQGGTYEWTNMTLEPNNDTSMTTANYQAIGKLTSDAGISVYMSYHMVTKNGGDGGSGAYSFDITISLKEVWGYASAVHFDSRFFDDSDRDEAWQKSLFANFDAGYPVCMGIPGHAIVADGYGYNSNYDYVHLNLGWAGSSDFWYNLPNVTEAGYSSFTNVQSITYNVFPDKGMGYGVVSGRILDGDRLPQSGAKVEVWKGSALVDETVSTGTGVWGVSVPAGTYTVCATSADGKSTGSLANVSVKAPSTSLVNYNSLGRETPTVFDVEDLGISWGNDITLVKAAAFEELEHPAFVPYTRVTRTAGGTKAEKVGACFTNGNEIVYSLLTEKGRAYALGQDGQPAGDWVTGDGTPQLLRAPKLASGAYKVLVKNAD